MNFSCASRLKVAHWRTRAVAPPLGMYVAWSQLSTAPAPPKSAISSRRRLSSASLASAERRFPLRLPGSTLALLALVAILDLPLRAAVMVEGMGGLLLGEKGRHPSMIHALDHIVLAVPSVDVAAAGYRLLLGRRGDGASFQLANVRLDLRALDGAASEGLSALAFAVGDMDKAQRLLQQRALSVTRAEARRQIAGLAHRPGGDAWGCDIRPRAQSRGDAHSRLRRLTGAEGPARWRASITW